MRTMRVVNSTRGREIGSRVGMADSWWNRFRGLIGRPEIESGEGLLLEPCRAVHMYGMTYPLDVAFLDEDGVVIALYRELAPGARSHWHGSARYALEIPAGTLASTATEVGDVIHWTPTEKGSNGRELHAAGTR